MVGAEPSWLVACHTGRDSQENGYGELNCSLESPEPKAYSANMVMCAFAKICCMQILILSGFIPAAPSKGTY